MEVRLSVRPEPDQAIRSNGEVGAPALAEATAAARRYLLSIQHADGHWCGELEGDTILESEYALTFWFLGRGDEPRVRKAGEYLRRKQLAEGGWSIYPGGPAEVSASVKAYFVLKLLGDDPEAPHMVKARNAVLRLGGVEACNSFTKIYLAIFG
ncbi:MAG TPA: prenyltransferase/squalene oxidase repeat-containing protein, partial [Thermoanaerobaculia bacterium]|nr:prenyltransferase/squalene oxidase repeat-containing protein [Thermoanaerobaculia bacterium]